VSAFDPSAPGLPIVGGGGASLPTTPASALLDAANPGKIVGLAQVTGAGTSFEPDVVVEAGVGLAAGTTAGATLVGDGTEGAVLTSATISALLASADAAAARTALGVQDGPRLIPLASYTTTVSTVDVAIGGARFDPADYAITARTTVLALDAIGQVVSGVTGTLTLYNLTDSVDAATPIQWTETSATRKTASVTLPTTPKVYELRLKKSGGAVSDYAVISTANIRITWS
jgi:hypothetical protein